MKKQETKCIGLISQTYTKREIFSEYFIQCLERAGDLLLKNVDLSILSARFKNDLSQEAIFLNNKGVSCPESFNQLFTLVMKNQMKASLVGGNFWFSSVKDM